MSSAERDPRVLYIAGYLRSGSTILSSLLATSPSCVEVGETVNIWRGMSRNSPCGCGLPLRQCPVWGEVLPAVMEASGYRYPQDLPAVHRLSQETIRLRRLVLGKHNLRRPAAVEYAALLQCLYRTRAEQAGASIVIDESKSAAMIPLLETLELPWTLVHLVRDPRAVAGSESRGGSWPGVDPGDMPPRRHPVVSAALWLLNNRVVDACARQVDAPVLRQLYEELARAPQSTVDTLLKAVDAEPSRFWTSPTELSLPQGHNPAGNPSRLFWGPTTVSHRPVKAPEFDTAVRMLTGRYWRGVLR